MLGLVVLQQFIIIHIIQHMPTKWYFFIFVIDIPSTNENINSFGSGLFGNLSSILTSFQFSWNKTLNCLSLHSEGTHFQSTTKSNREITTPPSHNVQCKIPKFISKFAIWLTVMYLNSWARSTLMKLTTSFAKIACQKFCEMHCNWSKIQQFTHQSHLR